MTGPFLNFLLPKDITSKVCTMSARLAGLVARYQAGESAGKNDSADALDASARCRFLGSPKGDRLNMRRRNERSRIVVSDADAQPNPPGRAGVAINGDLIGRPRDGLKA